MDTRLPFALNANGTPATGYTGTIHFTSSDTKAILPVDYTFTTADAGTHTFTVTLKTGCAGQTIKVADTLSRTRGHHDCVGNTRQCLQVHGREFPLFRSGRRSENFTVTAYDAYGNVATGYAGTVRFLSSDSQAILPANYTFNAADAGGLLRGYAPRPPEAQTITSTDIQTGTITGTQSISIVNSSSQSAVSLSVAGVSNATTARHISITVSALTTSGTIATGYSGTIHFSVSDWQAVLLANYTFTAADAGSHTFTLTLKSALVGQVVKVADTANARIAGVATTQVIPAPATKFNVANFATPDPSGAFRALA